LTCCNLFIVLTRIYFLVINIGTFCTVLYTYANRVCIIKMVFFMKISTGIIVSTSHLDASIGLWENDVTD